MAVVQAPLGGQVNTEDDDEAPAAVTAPGLAALQFQGPYQAIYQQMQQKADAQRAAQQQMLGTLQQQESALGQTGMSDYDRASMLFQAAGALGQTTRSGGFGETLGNVGTALAGPLSKAAEAQRQRQSQLQQLQMARQKLGVEMAGTGGVDPAQALQLLKAQQDAQPKLTERERLLQGADLTPEQKKAARLEALGIRDSEEDEVKNVYINGRQTSVIMRGGKPVDLVTGQPLDPSKLAAAEEEKPDIKNIIVGGNTVSVRYINGKPVDPITGEPFDPQKVAAVAQAAELSDRKAAALEAGIPLPEVDPARNISSPKEKDRFRAQQANAANNFLLKEEEKLPTSKLQQDAGSAKRFLELNSERQRQTGPGMGVLWSVSPSNREMNALSIQISRGMRQTGEGSMSDYDAQQFAKASIGTGNNYGTNYNLGTAYIKAKELEQERREFFRSYVGQNGTLQDAQKHWNKYLKENPIFDPTKGVQSDSTKIRLNPNRMEYTDYFKKQMGPRTFERGPDGQLILQQGQQP